MFAQYRDIAGFLSYADLAFGLSFLTCEYKATPEIAIAVPRMLSVLTGFRKTRTDDTMTATRFMVFPTAWVTGLTLWRTM